MLQAFSERQTQVEWHLGYDIDEARDWLGETG
jgi:hypothetical protein